jgi:polyhydroxyalkanoate synthesis regulator phasin
MFNLKTKVSAVLAALLCAGPILAQDSGALIEALVRKGILNDQEAEEIRADLVRDASMPPAVGTAGSNYTTRLRISGRLQTQFTNLETDIANAADPEGTSHFFMRRVYLTARADLGADWNTNITYDFAGGFFDAAWVQYKQGAHTVDIGLRKVNLGYEERTSSGSLKAIERSGVTRYFVEENNGRRLGAGSYRVGVFADGKQGNFFYGGAITNPERAITAAVSAGTGNNTNNDLAYWANAGYNGKFDGGTYVIGGGYGFLPNQGGKAGASPFGVGTGNDLSVYSLYFDLTVGKMSLVTEYLAADVERGVSATRDAEPTGWWIQPSYAVSDRLELVGRYSHLDSDGRGVNVSDGVRSAPGGGTHDKLSEMYLGVNYYLKGNDLKLQLGYVWGKSEDTLTGGFAEAKATGLRSQVQLNF